MKKIILSTSNVYEEKAKEFSKTKLSKRLEKKYKPKPYEEQYKPIYLLSLISSYLCNVFSIVTASTFVFTYLVSIVEELPYPFIIASVFTLTLLVMIEALQRFLAPTLFKSVLQYGFKSYYIVLILAIVGASSISVFFSYNGGFDIVTNFTNEPQYTEPQLKNIAELKEEYRVLFLEKEEKIKEYKNSKKYRNSKGELLYNIVQKTIPNLEKEKGELQLQQIAKISEYESFNEKKTTKAKEEYKSSLEGYLSANKSKGGGLSIASIIAQLLFFISIFFTEFYDYRTASQYATIEEHIDIDSQNLNNRLPTTEEPTHNSLLEPTKTEEASPKTVYKNKYTIEHICKNTGKKKYYTLSQVNNFLKVYKDRITTAKEKGREELLEARGKSLNYWKGKQEELLLKMQLNES